MLWSLFRCGKPGCHFASQEAALEQLAAEKMAAEKVPDRSE